MKLAFIGKMFSGKTTAADYLTTMHGYERLAFARPVKDLAAEILTLVEARIGNSVPTIFSFSNMNEEDIEKARREIIEHYEDGNAHKPMVFSHSDVQIQRLPPKVWTFQDVEQKKGHPAVRKLLQLVGTELGRELIGYEDIWVDKLIQAAHNIENAVVDDCRFPNEANALRGQGFTLVRVTRPEEERLDMMQAKYPANFSEILNHPSELGLDSFEADVVFYAESVEELLDMVESLITKES